MISNLEVLNLQHRIRYLEHMMREIHQALQGRGQNKQIDVPRARNLCRWALGLDIPYHEPEWLGDVRDEKDREARMKSI